MNKFIIGLIFSSVTVFASGVMTVEGTMYGKTEQSFMVKSHNEIFKFKKAGLNNDQLNYLENLKWGEVVRVDVPTNSIQEVKTVSTKK